MRATPAPASGDDQARTLPSIIQTVIEEHTVSYETLAHHLKLAVPDLLRAAHGQRALTDRELTRLADYTGVDARIWQRRQAVYLRLSDPSQSSQSSQSSRPKR